MRALDTNVLLRAILRDNPIQTATALALLDTPCTVSPTVMLEIVWFLWRRAKLPMDVIRLAINRLADLPHLVVAERAAVVWALDGARTGRDFADMLHVALAIGAAHFTTFDRRIARIAIDPPVPIETLD